MKAFLGLFGLIQIVRIGVVFIRYGLKDWQGVDYS